MYGVYGLAQVRITALACIPRRISPGVHLLGLGRFLRLVEVASLHLRGYLVGSDFHLVEIRHVKRNLSPVSGAQLDRRAVAAWWVLKASAFHIGQVLYVDSAYPMQRGYPSQIH